MARIGWRHLRTAALRALPALFVVPLLALGAVALTPGSACACSCAEMPTERAFAEADVVFVGRVVDRTVDRGFPWLVRSSADKAVWTFEVTATYKGDGVRRQEIVTADSGASCGLELSGPGPFVVYGTRDAAEPAPEEGQYAANLCGGSAPLTAAIERDLDDRAGAGVRGTPPGPSGGPSHGLPGAVLAALAALGAALASLAGWILLR